MIRIINKWFFPFSTKYHKLLVIKLYHRLAFNSILPICCFSWHQKKTASTTNKVLNNVFVSKQFYFRKWFMARVEDEICLSTDQIVESFLSFSRYIELYLELNRCPTILKEISSWKLPSLKKIYFYGNKIESI